jgi:hypothetical protein
MMEEEFELECDVGVERRRAWTWLTCMVANAERMGVGKIRSECRMWARAWMGTIETQGDGGGEVRAHCGHDKDAEQVAGA